MKVIFLEHVLHVAKAGEMKEVSSGYASNYLFPKKLAKPYTRDMAQVHEKKIHQQEAQRRMLLGDKDKIVKTLEGKVCQLYLPGKGGKSQGSIRQADVATYIQHHFHIPIHKKHIVFCDHHGSLKVFGDHDIYIDLGNNFACKMIVRITQKV